MIDQFDAAGVQLVVRTLEEIEQDACRHDPLRRHDGVACFDYLYTVITKNVLCCVTGEVGPNDPAFMDRGFMACLDVAFANRYLAAMGIDGGPAFQPRCWQTLIDHRETADISPLIFAVAGVNAHVNFDLPFALVTACTKLARELDSGHNHEDYQLINQIFAKHMRQLRRHFEDRFARGFDTAVVSKVENMLGNLVVVVARNLAWTTAQRLWRVHEDEVEMLRREKARDRSVAWVNQALFEIGRLPAVAFRAMSVIPGPTRRAGRRGLSRTGHAALAPPGTMVA